MRTTILSAALATFVIACGPPPAGRGDDGGDDGGDDDSGTVDADIDPGLGECGAQQTNIGVVNLGPPPDMLVVLDRSGSMTAPVGLFPTFPFVTRWATMKDSLNATVMDYQQNIKFGLLEFPSDNDCAADQTPEVNIGLGNASGFASYFSSHSPNGNTPSHLALQGALVYYSSIPVNPDGRYVLFATDGEPNCMGEDTAAAAAATVDAIEALHTAGIKTIVLGFGSFGGGSVLNDAAVAGGMPRPGAKKYYEANDAATLGMALEQIAGGVIQPSCDFALQSVPPDPNNVTVTINGMPVPRSTAHTNGWDYYPDAMTITFFGQYCTDVMNGASSDVEFLYGCPGPVIN